LDIDLGRKIENLLIKILGFYGKKLVKRVLDWYCGVEGEGEGCFELGIVKNLWVIGRGIGDGGLGVGDGGLIERLNCALSAELVVMSFGVGNLKVLGLEVVLRSVL
jgi:hypothetical protein